MSGDAGRNDGVIDWREKALWTVDRPTPIDAFVEEGHRLFDGSVSWPALVLREPALRANIATMAAYTRRHGMLFAPHGKTSMIPELFRWQLEAGAWGITVATAQQAMVALRTGTLRVLIAHEVLDGPALRRLLAVRDELRAGSPAGGSPGTELLCFVDSAEGVRLAGEAVAASADGSREATPLPVLIDVGFAGGRTGVRSVGEALGLARVIRETPGVELVGVACYEGGLPGENEVRAFLGTLREVAEALLDAGELEAGELGSGSLGPGALGSSPLVSAGGSAYFDVVASELAGPWAESRGVRILLRSGAYVTHDDRDYAERTPFLRVPEEGELQPALELWAQVVSVPEPGLALVGMGKRDAPFDEGLPVPKLLRRTGKTELVDLSGLAETTRLNDQHGYVRFDGSLPIRPGDLIGFGISHPCTAFDRWRLLPLLDAQDRIIDVWRTYF